MVSSVYSHIYGAGYYGGQSWLATSFTLGKIKVRLKRIGTSPGTLYCKLYAEDGSDAPTGGILSTGSVNGNDITTDAAGELVEFTMDSNYAVANGNKYVFILTAPDGNSSNKIAMLNLGNVYADGKLGYAVGGGYITAAAADFPFEIWSADATNDFTTFDIVETEMDVLNLLSTTTVAFNADADTTLYTVPTGKRCVLSHAIVVAAGDAGATTTVSIGANGTETDFIPANTLSNLDAQYDAVILQPIPNTTPLKIKSYAAATVIEAQVASQSGAAGNTVYLFGITY